jgi:hypothetical protein
MKTKIFTILFAALFFTQSVLSQEIVYWFERSIGALEQTADKKSFLLETDMLFKKTDRGNPVPTSKRWKDGVIPFTFKSGSFSNRDKEIIRDAARRLSNVTNLSVVPRTNESNYVEIFRGNGCYSYIGMIGGKQKLSLGMGCIEKGTVMHEFIHAAGVLHEQSRNDRDDFLNMNWNNIRPGKRGNFTVVRHSGFGEYDYKSIMHYESMVMDPSFVYNTNQPVFVKKNGGLITRNSKLTQTDIDSINFLYTNGAQLDKCLELKYYDKKSFDRDLKGYLERENEKGVCIKFSSDYKLEQLPTRVEKWLSKVKEEGGTVEQVEVSRSLVWHIVSYIFRALSGIFEDIYAPAKNYNAKIYFDKATKTVLKVEFNLK